MSEPIGPSDVDAVVESVQLGVPGAATYIPFAGTAGRPGAPDEAIHVADGAGRDGALLVLQSTGALLAGVVARSAASVRSQHVWGASDPSGFAAMGIVELLVHMHDLTVGTEVDWDPSPQLCDRVLDRLFPDVEVGDDPWESLLWATGRFASPTRPRRESWRWYGEPR